MRVTKIVVGRGKSAPVGGPEGEWLKTFYQVEAELDVDEDPEAARLSLEHILDQWLQGKVAGPEIPKLDLADLEELPWTSYKTKERCQPGEAGWIFANTQGAEELVEAIRRVGKLELGEYMFQFSGKENQFISRRPLKRSSNPHDRMEKNLRNIQSAASRMGLKR